MKTVIISVRDIVSNLYTSPFFMQSKGAAVRAFSDQVNKADENNNLYKHPNDFELYYLGTFDDENGTFELVSNPEQIALARDYVIK